MQFICGSVIHVYILTLLLLSCIPQAKVFAQDHVHAFGLRFGSDFNHFFQPERLTPLINGTFSTLVLGGFYKHYYVNAVLEVGVNWLVKEQSGRLVFPVVMQNFREGENTGLTAVEGQFMVGPRIWYFYPKFGFIASRIIHLDGAVSQPDLNLKLLEWNLSIPVGFSFDFPTSFGSTGFGGYYDIGLSRVIETKDYMHGGRLRAWNFELHVAFRLGSGDNRN